MNCLNFNTNTPLEHIPRVLDLLRVMSFDLDDLQVGSRDNGVFCVMVTCRALQKEGLETLRGRIQKIPGIHKLHCI